MYLFIENDDLLEKCDNIWDRFSANIKKEFDRGPLYNFLKTKIKSQGNEATDLYDKEIPKLDSNHTCLGEINLNSAFNKDGSYYPQVFLKEYKYIMNKKHNCSGPLAFRTQGVGYQSNQKLSAQSIYSFLRYSSFQGLMN